MKIKEEYQDNLVGAFAGNYDRPIGSESYKKFYDFTNYRHEPSKMCFSYDINLSKYEMLDTKDKINSYFIKEEAKTSTIVGPATLIEKESLLYTCKRHRCIFPCLCVSCVLQTSECSEHNFIHPDLFDNDNDRLLLRTPHNYKIGQIREPTNTFREVVFAQIPYEDPVVEIYKYAGIKKDCDACSSDLYNHSAYHFIYHDNCKFCRFSAYRFDGITTRKEFCIRTDIRDCEENNSCCLCYKIFRSEKIKDNHIKNVHQNGGDFLCDECGRIFASKVALEYHLKSLHRVEEQWMCKHCKKTFNMKHSLNVHVRNVHSMKTFVCKICSKVFSRLSHFIRHAKYVHGEQRNYFVLDDYPEILYYKCDQCSFQSRYNTNLHKHIATIHKDTKFSCNMCTFISNRQDNLQRHVTTLHSNAKYQCSECEFVSNRNDNFNRHIHTIHGEEKFTCDECDFTTNRNDNLLRHIDFIHGEEIRYSCSECDFICHVEKNMKEHMEIVHFEEYKCVFNCHECNFVTDSSDCLKNHLETKHSVKFEEFNCNDCNFVSKRKNEFKRHIETVHKKEDKFKCAECNFVCNRSDELKRHDQTVHNKEKEFKCAECNFVSYRSDKLNRHIETVHNKEEEFKCAECNFVSYRSDELNRHIQTVHNKEKKMNCKLCIYACNRKDNMKRHIEKVHSGDVKSNLMSADTNTNLLVCEECNKSFLKKDDYKRHLALHNNLDKTWIPNNDDVDLDDLEKTMETQVEVGKQNPEEPARVLKETEG